MSFGVSFELDNIKYYQPDFDHFKNDPDGEIGEHLAKRGTAILLAAQQQVGVDTGALRASLYMLHYRQGAHQEIRIGSDNDHAMIHHEGSRPHAIAARGNHVLRFAGRGRVVYSHSVLHPGTRPNRYLSDNLSLVYV